MLGDSSSGDVASAAAATSTAAAGAGGASREAAVAAAHHEGGEATAAAAASAIGGGAGSSNSGEDDKGRVMDEFGERGFGGNRWPRQETLALLKIRSDMEVAFRDASVKGPLWEEVSRKLAELGYNRSAKKCKEKFENVFKYHKRTKEGRTSKGQSKTYKFFDQLEAFEHHHHSSLSSPTQPPPPPKPHRQPQPVVNAQPVSMQHPTVPVTITTATTTVPSTTSTAVLSHQPTVGTLPVSVPPINVTSIPSFPPITTNPAPPPSQPNTNPKPTVPAQINIPSTFQSIPKDLLSNSTSSSSTSSDYEFGGRRKRKRKWRDFFERLMKEVVHKQEDLQKKFLEAIEKRERERVVREEAWRMQEMTRINREREILAQERSMAAAKDAAVMAFLQKLSEQQPNLSPPVQLLQNNTANNNRPQSQPAPPTPQPAAPPAPSQTQPQPQPQPQPQQQPQPQPQQQQTHPPPPQQHQVVMNLEQPRSTADNGDQITINNNNNSNNNNNFMAASSSRWPKVEVEALIKLRTNLDAKYQENVPKGPLWEEISAGMRKIGYNRSAKRCKEKWENINKYFKKVKESNKKRPEDSKTCPYFNSLEILYKEKNKFDGSNISSNSTPQAIKPENSVPLMVTPEQQWPPATTVAMMTSVGQSQSGHHNQQQQHRQDSVMEDAESDQNMDGDDKDDGDDEEDDDDDGAGGFELVASNNSNNNKQVSMNAAG